MIIDLTPQTTNSQATHLAQQLNATLLKTEDRYTIITSSKIKTVDPKHQPIIEKTFLFENDLQLASKQYRPQTRTVHLGNGKTIGGTTNHTVMIAGPCSVEDQSQMQQTAELLKELGISILRGGCYKPRTSPYSFQGLGLEGLKILTDIKQQYGHTIITEVRDATHVAEVIEHTDIIQIGAKAMYDHGILKACGNTQKPVLLKRGFGTTLQEFAQAAEFILSAGNPNVLLCERGIRTFETKTRFTLDLCGVAYLKEHTNLPVVLDPSHAMGYRYGVADLTRACMAMGIDGLIIEVHPNPVAAKSDAAQQLSHEEFRMLYKSLPPIAKAIGRQLI